MDLLWALLFVCTGFAGGLVTGYLIPRATESIPRRSIRHSVMGVEEE